MRLILLVVIAASAPAAAQVNTRCTTNYGVTNCQSNDVGAQQRAPWEALRQSQENSSQAFSNMLADQQRRNEQARNAEAQQRYAVASAEPEHEVKMEHRRHAGALIRQGRCDDALNYMLDQGELELANEVKLLCAK